MDKKTGRYFLEYRRAMLICVNQQGQYKVFPFFFHTFAG
jgi:hypothetical protein